MLCWVKMERKVTVWSKQTHCVCNPIHQILINVREYRRGNHNSTIQRNWQQDEEKQSKNTTQYTVCWMPLCGTLMALHKQENI
jgi:hypothetical protein